MSGLGIIGTVLLFIVMVLLSVIPSVLLAAACFYACWYAVKNSPTLRTRRFAISAALDTCVLLWHLTAFSFLVYSLSAAAFCYLLRAGERR